MSAAAVHPPQPVPDVHSGTAAAAPLQLTPVEHTAVLVSWSRWHAALQYKDKPSTDGSDEEGTPLFDGSFDEALSRQLSAEDRARLEARLVARQGSLHQWMMAVRTVSLDDALMRATGGPVHTPADRVRRQPKVTSGLPTASIRQVGIIGAGLDARAWRLPWPAGVTLFEVDTGSVEGLKARTFAHLPLRVAARHALVADLNDTQRLEDVLLGSGFSTQEPVVWLLEGLIGYLAREKGLELLSKLKQLSAPGSQLLVLTQPSPERYEELKVSGHAPPHAMYELHHETHERVRVAGWETAELVSAEKLEQIYGMDCKQAQVHAVA